ncbi:MAG: glucose 1-dehydrogenase [Phycisphaerales bacterium]|jgi:glucose 1-dehydrogenase|nr:glucose 1-dehydrogenase [Phycisphaerales bacterium]
MKLQDKVALVTGANSGIGKGIATRFAAEGARVVINYHSPKDDQQAQAMARDLGHDSIALIGDVSKRTNVQRMMSQIVERFGRLDIAVNNAGIEIKKPFLEATDEEWDRVMGVNVSGVFYVSQSAASQMVKQGGGGKIINISSVHEDIPFSGYTSYCASKGAVRMMMRNLAIELAPYRINVNNIAPGAIATPINRAVLDDPNAKEQAIEEIPWGRFGQPDEVAAVAAFLASDEAQYVTGSTYTIDGGLVRQVTKY